MGKPMANPNEPSSTPVELVDFRSGEKILYYLETYNERRDIPGAARRGTRKE